MAPNTAEELISARRAEIELKTGRIRKMLEDNGLDGVVLMKHPNFSWITAGGKNFVANCFDAGAATILVTKEKRYALCSIIEAPRIRDEEMLPALGFELLVYGWEEDKTLELVREIVNPQKTISDTSFGGIKENQSLIAPLRRQLTDFEVARYHYLGDTMSLALEECLLTVKPGMTEYEIAGEISRALWPHNIEQVMHLVTADERGNHYRHGLPTEKKLKKSLIVSVNGRYKGLITTVSRMIHFGAPPEHLLNRYHDCLEIECAAISKMAVGSDEIEAYHTLKAEYARREFPDMFERHAQGGCQGYYPREYTITPQVHHAIKDNQAYCFNPVIDGAKTEDAFIVRNSGCEFITRPMVFDKMIIGINGVGIERPCLMIVKA